MEPTAGRLQTMWCFMTRSYMLYLIMRSNINVIAIIIETSTSLSPSVVPPSYRILPPCSGKVLFSSPSWKAGGEPPPPQQPKIKTHGR